LHRSIGLLLFLLAAPFDALAAEEPVLPARHFDDLTELSLTELANIQVSSVSRREESKAQTRAAIQVITADELSRAGVTALADALALSPGVAVARADSSGWATGIRGFTGRLARAQLVMIDGRSVYDPLFAGTYWEVQDTLLEDIDRIEVVRGPGGTLWGANAVNGIVSVVTRSARQTPGGLVSVGVGNEELLGNARYGGALGSRGAYRVYAKSFERDASWHPDGSEYDDWRMSQGGFRTDFDLASTETLTFQGDLYSGRAGQRTRVTSYELPYLRDIDQDARLAGGNLLARWTRGPLRVQGFFDRSDRQEIKFGELRHTLDLDLQHQLGRFGRHDLVWGAGFRRSAGDSRGSLTVSVVPPRRVDQLFTGFAQDDISLAGDKLKIAVGAKLEHNDYSGFEIQPSARGVWKVSPRQSIWGAATRAVRTPSRIEHDIDVTVGSTATDPVFLRWFGNPDFVSETLRSFELGYRTELGESVSIDVSAFYNHYDQLLGLDPGSVSLEPGRVVISIFTANALEATSAGFETSVSVQPAPAWRVQADYSYLSLDLERRPGSQSITMGADEEGSSPRHQLRARSSFQLASRLELSAAFRWIDALPAQDVASYSELDARLAYAPTDKIELAVAGRNLLHAHHAEFRGDAPTPSEIERAVLASLRLRW
jgi:iron complex outermembrane receptor protein